MAVSPWRAEGYGGDELPTAALGHDGNAGGCRRQSFALRWGTYGRPSTICSERSTCSMVHALSTPSGFTNRCRSTARN